MASSTIIDVTACKAAAAAARPGERLRPPSDLHTWAFGGRQGAFAPGFCLYLTKFDYLVSLVFNNE